MKICFYTEGHIGDLLLPLPIIDKVIKKYPENEYYFYDKGGQQTILNHDLISIVDNLIPTDKIDGDINIPTWACNSQYNEFRNGISNGVPKDLKIVDYFSIYQYYLPKILKKHGLEIEISNECGIDFEYKIPNEIKEKITSIEKNFSKNIILFNQLPRSGQTDGSPWGSFLDEISSKYPSYNFFYTNKENVSLKPNLFWTPDLFGVHNCDILYNAYLSKFCKYSVARISGPPMFAIMHNDFVLDEKKILISQINSVGGVETFYNKSIYKVTNMQSGSSSESFQMLTSLLK